MNRFPTISIVLTFAALAAAFGTSPPRLLSHPALALAQAQPATSAPSAAPLAASSGAQAKPSHALHSITVTFNYDFTATPACTAKVTQRCVARFVAYDISGGYKTRSKLFVIPVPNGAAGKMQGISYTSPKMDFESGKHQLAVAAQGPTGTESRNYAATVWVNVP